MEKYFSIGEAAKAAHTTSETLRHYDRIGLVRPSRKDEWTNYRYYTPQDIVRINTVRALQMMDLSLAEAKKVLAYDDLEKVVEFLTQAEKKADDKIAQLQYSRAKIQSARTDYEKKLRMRENPGGTFIRELPERVLLLSDTLAVPTLDTLWNYLSHFYDRIAPEQRAQFDFEDLAGIYTENGTSRLFAVCIRYAKMDGIKVLPAGRYLCANCTEENRDQVLSEVMRTALADYGVMPAFTVQLIVVSGILQWHYQVQICLDSHFPAFLS